MEFFNEQGEATLYSPDGEHLFTWSEGKPIAYIHNGKLYDFSGTYRGWYENGWLFDKHGNRMLFMPEATGGPLKPLRKLKPLKGLRELKPLKGLRELAPLKPLKSSNWSNNRFW